jgi:RND family efflux transporter MFP subunit
MMQRQIRSQEIAARVLLCGLVVVVAACSAPRSALAHEGHAALPSKGLTVEGNQLLLSAGARDAIEVTTAKVTLANLGKTIECNARIELPWSQQALVTTQVPGRITHVLVHPGDRIEQWQPLAHLESLELESLQLALLQADAESALARDQLERRSTLAAEGAIPGSALLDAKAAYEQHSAELEIALCKLRALGLDENALDKVRSSGQPISKFSIVSPMAGVVANADVRPGQQVKTSEHLFHIVDLAQVWAIGEVLEGDVAQVAADQPVNVSFASLPGQSFTGQIEWLGIKMSEARRTRNVTVVVQNDSRLLRPGMFGRMSIQIAQSHEAIVCPTEALINDGGNHFVLLERGEGKYLRQPVRLGLRNHVQVEILDGLFPGDQVLVSGNHVLFSLFAKDTAGAAQKTVPPDSPPDESSRSSTPVTVVQGVVELPTDRKAFAGSRLEGRIARILVEHSQPVQAGQALAEVESLKLRNVQGELLETQSKLKWTSDRVARLSPLAEKHIASQSELWEMQTEERVLSAQRDSLLRTLELIGVSKDDVQRLVSTDLSQGDCDVTLVRSVPIRAPIAGRIADFDLVPGQIVDSQSTLFEVQDANKVWVKGYVFQHDAVRLATGQRVRVSFASKPDRVVSGVVVRLSPVLDSSERVMPLWVEVDNADGRLIEGMWARMEIDVEGPSNILTTAPSSSSTRVLPVGSGQ